MCSSRLTAGNSSAYCPCPVVSWVLARKKFKLGNVVTSIDEPVVLDGDGNSR